MLRWRLLCTIACFKWVPETAIPDVARLAFALAEKEGALM
jgi:hypothetical protein